MTYPYIKATLRYVSKNDVRLQKPLLLLCCFAITNTAPEDTKQSSGISVSEAALHFRISFAYKPSTLQKKPSDLQHGCTTNARPEKCSERRRNILDVDCSLQKRLQMQILTDFQPDMEHTLNHSQINSCFWRSPLAHVGIKVTGLILAH